MYSSRFKRGFGTETWREGVVGRLLDATVGYVVQKSRGSLFNLPDTVVLVLLFITQKMFRLPSAGSGLLLSF